MVLEKFDKRDVARRPKAEDEGEAHPARSNRQLAAVSELCECIVRPGRAGAAPRYRYRARTQHANAPNAGERKTRSAAQNVNIS